MRAQLAVSLVLVCATARADTAFEHGDAEHGGLLDGRFGDPRLPRGFGLGVELGGGIVGFTDHAMRDVTPPVGGMWALRAAFGTHVPFAIEVAYLGSATQVRSMTLLGTTFETDLRFNVLPHSLLDPYAFAGVGWQHFSLDDLQRSDDVLAIPVGGGLAYRYRGFITDVRGTFRATRDAHLVVENGGYAPLHSWEASVAVGYEL